MFVPGHNERLMKSAENSDADVLLLDIEDSVQPAAYKQLARDLIKKMLSEGKFSGRTVFPRVNDRESGHLLQDISQLAIPGITGFMYPKSQSGSDISFFDKLLETIEYEKGVPVGTYKIIPLIETAGAVLNAQEICCASKRVRAIAFGCEDFVTDVSGMHDSEGQSIFAARALIVMAARASGVLPIDTVHINVHDHDDLEQNLALAKKMGFEGMLVLNPKELPLVHKYFSPSEKEVEDAKEIMRLYDEAQKEAKGVAIMRNKFIGPPMVRAAEKIILKKELIKTRAGK